MSAAAQSLGLPDPDEKPQFYQNILPKRLIAWVIDVVLIFIFCLLVLPFTAFTGIFFFPVMMIVLGFFYRWFTISNRSATWGMRVMGIQLRDIDGEPLESGQAFAHTLGYTISVTVAPLQLISIIMMIVSARKQGLTDHLLGTAAINRPAR